MSEFKGTKREWYVFDNGQFPEIKLKDQHVGQICMMPYSDAEFEKAVNSKEENEANAKLIAAAPELLKALQDINKAFKNATKVNGKVCMTIGMADTIIVSQKAIKKAL